MANFLLQAGLTLFGLVCGGYVLLAGRRMPWVSLGIIGLVTSANVLASLVASLDSGFDLLYQGEWLMLFTAVAIGALGFYVGRLRPDLAVTIIGMAAGVDIALWFEAINRYLSTELIQAEAETAVFFNLPLMLLGALLGWWFIRRFRDEGLIVITVIMGVEILSLALRLNTSSSFTAVLVLSLALVGVVVQYAHYLRGLKADASLEPTAAPALPELLAPYDWNGR
ncbi:MAG: hypothetical protein IPM39_25645 [Chloroflexi bacterium]|nr:hypothetical protein [Chloroflexota bacterium]